jgi:hypothetical protein
MSGNGRILMVGFAVVLIVVQTASCLLSRFYAGELCQHGPALLDGC